MPMYRQWLSRGNIVQGTYLQISGVGELLDEAGDTKLIGGLRGGGGGDVIDSLYTKLAVLKVMLILYTTDLQARRRNRRGTRRGDGIRNWCSISHGRSPLLHCCELGARRHRAREASGRVEEVYKKTGK